MHRRSMLAVLASCLVAGPALAQSPELKSGPFAMRWPRGYRVVRRTAPLVLAGPDAQEVSMSVHAAGSEAAPAGIAAGEALVAEVERSMRIVRSAGESFGELVVPVTRTVLRDGSVLVACASQWRGFSTSYLLQFNVLSLAGDMAYLTVEGRGRGGVAEYQRLLPHFQSVRWTRDPHAA